MPRLRKVSGETAIKILCNKFGFEVSGRSGSHVRLSKMTPKGKVGTVVLLHSLNRAYLASCLRHFAQILLRRTSDTLGTLYAIAKFGGRCKNVGDKI